MNLTQSSRDASLLWRSLSQSVCSLVVIIINNHLCNQLFIVGVLPFDFRLEHIKIGIAIDKTPPQTGCITVLLLPTTNHLISFSHIADRALR